MKRVISGLAVALVIIIAGLGLSSCVGESYWYDDSDNYDHRLDGYWELELVNGRPVYGDDVNYLYFGGRGRGLYYYYYRGGRYIEDTYYNSQWSNNGVSDYQLNIQYGYDRPTTINYWFNGGNTALTMQWRPAGSSGPVTYTYGRISYRPW